MFRRFKQSLYRFMQDRYGFDSLSNALLMLTMLLVVINFILCMTPLRLVCGLVSMVAWICLIVSYARVFSKNYVKRNSENEWYIKKTARIREGFRIYRARRRIRRTHHIYSCPGCTQKIKIPKGKGKVVITCPKCRMEFTKIS